MKATPSQSKEKGYLAGFLKWLPVIQWVLMLIMTVGGIILYQRDSQTAQAQEVKDNRRDITEVKISTDKQKEDFTQKIEQLRKEMLTRELYEAYHKNDVEKFDRIEKLLEQNLQNSNRYPR